MFNFFKKKSPEAVFRTKIRNGFEDTVKNATRQLVGDPLTDGILVQTAIGSFRQFLLSSPSVMYLQLSAKEWSPTDIIEEEFKRTMDKYIKY